MSKNIRIAEKKAAAGETPYLPPEALRALAEAEERRKTAGRKTQLKKSAGAATGKAFARI